MPRAEMPVGTSRPVYQGGRGSRLEPWALLRPACLVLSINLIHCGSEFRNSAPVRTFPEPRLPFEGQAAASMAISSLVGIRRSPYSQRPPARRARACCWLLVVAVPDVHGRRRYGSMRGVDCSGVVAVSSSAEVRVRSTKPGRSKSKSGKGRKRKGADWGAGHVSD